MTQEVVQSDVELAHVASELLDTEARQVFDVVLAIQMKYQYRASTPDNLDMLRDEILTRLAEIGVLATVDPTPCLYGEAPVVEIIGKVAGDPLHKHGFDHEQKSFEVRKAKERNEEYLGQKERPNSRTRAEE